MTRTRARAICGALTAILTGVSYATSAQMAAELGAFPGYDDNADHMMRVMRNHRRAAWSAQDGYEDLATKPVALDAENCPDAFLIERARAAWDLAVDLGAEAWLSAMRRPVRHRADRHDRAGHGL